jgi:hypothetical protein
MLNWELSKNTQEYGMKGRASRDLNVTKQNKTNYLAS